MSGEHSAAGAIPGVKSNALFERYRRARQPQEAQSGEPITRINPLAQLSSPAGRKDTVIPITLSPASGPAGASSPYTRRQTQPPLPPLVSITAPRPVGSVEQALSAVAKRYAPQVVAEEEAAAATAAEAGAPPVTPEPSPLRLPSLPALPLPMRSRAATADPAPRPREVQPSCRLMVILALFMLVQTAVAVVIALFLTTKLIKIDPSTSDTFSILANALVVTPSGRVGVNAAAPSATMDIAAPVREPLLVQLRSADNTTQSIELGSVDAMSGGFVRAAAIRADTQRRLVLEAARNVSAPGSGAVLINAQDAGDVALAAGGGFVGVGTTRPLSRLHVANGSVVVEGGLSAADVSAASVRVRGAVEVGADVNVAGAVRAAYLEAAVFNVTQTINLAHNFEIDKLLVYGSLTVNATTATLDTVSVRGVAAIGTLNVTQNAVLGAPLSVTAPATFAAPIRAAASLSAAALQTPTLTVTSTLSMAAGAAVRGAVLVQDALTASSEVSMLGNVTTGTTDNDRLLVRGVLKLGTRSVYPLASAGRPDGSARLEVDGGAVLSGSLVLGTLTGAPPATDKLTVLGGSSTLGGDVAVSGTLHATGSVSAAGLIVAQSGLQSNADLSVASLASTGALSVGRETVLGGPTRVDGPVLLTQPVQLGSANGSAVAANTSLLLDVYVPVQMHQPVALFGAGGSGAGTTAQAAALTASGALLSVQGDTQLVGTLRVRNGSSPAAPSLAVAVDAAGTASLQGSALQILASGDVQALRNLTAGALSARLAVTASTLTAQSGSGAQNVLVASTVADSTLTVQAQPAGTLAQVELRSGSNASFALQTRGTALSLLQGGIELWRASTAAGLELQLPVSAPSLQVATHITAAALTVSSTGGAGQQVLLTAPASSAELSLLAGSGSSSALHLSTRLPSGAGANFSLVNSGPGGTLSLLENGAAVLRVAGGALNATGPLWAQTVATPGAVSAAGLTVAVPGTQDVLLRSHAGNASLTLAAPASVASAVLTGATEARVQLAVGSSSTAPSSFVMRTLGPSWLLEQDGVRIAAARAAGVDFATTVSADSATVRGQTATQYLLVSSAGPQNVTLASGNASTVLRLEAATNASATLELSPAGAVAYALSSGSDGVLRLVGSGGATVARVSGTNVTVSARLDADTVVGRSLLTGAALYVASAGAQNAQLVSTAANASLYITGSAEASLQLETTAAGGGGGGGGGATLFRWTAQAADQSLVLRTPSRTVLTVWPSAALTQFNTSLTSTGSLLAAAGVFASAAVLSTPGTQSSTIASMTADSTLSVLSGTGSLAAVRLGSGGGGGGAGAGENFTLAVNASARTLTLSGGSTTVLRVTGGHVYASGALSAAGAVTAASGVQTAALTASQSGAAQVSEFRSDSSTATVTVRAGPAASAALRLASTGGAAVGVRVQGDTGALVLDQGGVDVLSALDGRLNVTWATTVAALTSLANITGQQALLETSGAAAQHSVIRSRGADAQLQIATLDASSAVTLALDTPSSVFALRAGAGALTLSESGAGVLTVQNGTLDAANLLRAGTLSSRGLASLAGALVQNGSQPALLRVQSPGSAAEVRIGSDASTATLRLQAAAGHPYELQATAAGRWSLLSNGSEALGVDRNGTVFAAQSVYVPALYSADVLQSATLLVSRSTGAQQVLLASGDSAASLLVRAAGSGNAAALRLVGERISGSGGSGGAIDNEAELRMQDGTASLLVNASTVWSATAQQLSVAVPFSALSLSTAALTASATDGAAIDALIQSNSSRATVSVVAGGSGLASSAALRLGTVVGRAAGGWGDIVLQRAAANQFSIWANSSVASGGSATRMLQLDLVSNGSALLQVAGAGSFAGGLSAASLSAASLEVRGSNSTPLARVRNTAAGNASVSIEASSGGQAALILQEGSGNSVTLRSASNTLTVDLGSANAGAATLSGVGDLALAGTLLSAGPMRTLGSLSAGGDLTVRAAGAPATAIVRSDAAQALLSVQAAGSQSALVELSNAQRGVRFGVESNGSVVLAALPSGTPLWSIGAGSSTVEFHSLSARTASALSLQAERLWALSYADQTAVIESSVGVAALNITADNGMQSAALQLVRGGSQYALRHRSGDLFAVEGPTGSTLLTLDALGNAAFTGNISAPFATLAQQVQVSTLSARSSQTPQITVQSAGSSDATLAVTAPVGWAASVQLQSGAYAPAVLRVQSDGQFVLGNTSTPMLSIRSDGLVRAELGMTAVSLSVEGGTETRTLAVFAPGAAQQSRFVAGSGSSAVTVQASSGNSARLVLSDGAHEFALQKAAGAVALNVVLDGGSTPLLQLDHAGDLECAASVLAPTVTATEQFLGRQLALTAPAGSDQQSYVASADGHAAFGVVAPAALRTASVFLQTADARIELAHNGSALTVLRDQATLLTMQGATGDSVFAGSVTAPLLVSTGQMQAGSLIVRHAFGASTTARVESTGGAATLTLSAPATFASTLALLSGGTSMTLSHTDGIVQLGVSGNTALTVSTSGVVNAPIGFTASSVSTSGQLTSGGLQISASGALRPRFVSQTRAAVLSVEAAGTFAASVELRSGSDTVTLSNTDGLFEVTRLGSALQMLPTGVLQYSGTIQAPVLSASALLTGVSLSIGNPSQSSVFAATTGDSLLTVQAPNTSNAVLRLQRDGSPSQYMLQHLADGALALVRDADRLLYVDAGNAMTLGASVTAVSLAARTFRTTVQGPATLAQNVELGYSGDGGTFVMARAPSPAAATGAGWQLRGQDAGTTGGSVSIDGGVGGSSNGALLLGTASGAVTLSQSGRTSTVQGELVALETVTLGASGDAGFLMLRAPTSGLLASSWTLRGQDALAGTGGDVQIEPGAGSSAANNGLLHLGLTAPLVELSSVTRTTAVRGALLSNTVSVTGLLATGSASVTGALTAMSVTSLGHLQAATGQVLGALSANSLTVTTVVSSADLTASGTLSATYAVVGSSGLTASGRVTAASFSTAGTLTAAAGMETPATLTAGAVTVSSALSATTALLGSGGVQVSAGLTAASVSTSGSISAASLTASGSLSAADIAVGAGGLTSSGFVSIVGSLTSGGILLTGPATVSSLTSSGALSATQAVIGSSGLTASGPVTAASISAGGSISAASLTASGSLSAADVAVGSGGITSSGFVSITGSLTSGGILMTGPATVSSLTSSGALSATQVVVGTTGLTASGPVTAASIFTGGSLSAASLTASGSLSAADIALGVGGLTSSGFVSITGSLTSGGILLTGPATVSSLTSSGTLSATEAVIGSSGLTASGPVTAASISTGGSISAASLTASGSLSALGMALGSSGLTSSGFVSLAGSLTSGGILLTGPATVSSLTSSGTLSATQAVIGSSGLTASGPVTAASLSTSGSITAASLTASGSLSAADIAVGSGGITSSGFVSITGSLTSGGILMTGPATVSSLTSSGALSATQAVIGSSGLTASGPVTAASISTGGSISAASLTASGSLSAADMAVGSNGLTSSGFISITGSLTAVGGLTAGLVTATSLTATSTISAVSAVIGSNGLSASGAVTSGSLSAAGSVTVGSLTAGGSLTAVDVAVGTGGLTAGGFLSAAGAVTAAGLSLATGGSLTATDLIASGTLSSVAGLLGSGGLNVSGPLTAASLSVGGVVSASALETLGMLTALGSALGTAGLTTSGPVSLSGSLTALGAIVGADGITATGPVSTAGSLTAAALSTGGTLTAQAVEVGAGGLTASGNITAAAFSTSGALTSAALTATSLAVGSGGVSVAGTLTATAELQAAGLVQGGALSTAGILTVGTAVLATQLTPTPITPCETGQLAWDTAHLYICVALNTWYFVNTTALV